MREVVSVSGLAAGGDGVGRLADGRAVFVRGALPGERVELDVIEERPRFARAVVAKIVDASPERVEPPCPNVALGCGGCDWQHLDPAQQAARRAGLVVDALERIGRLEAVPEVDPGTPLPPGAHRTTVRAAVDRDGRAGFRVHHGHEVVPVGEVGCLVAHPLADELLRGGRFLGCDEVVVRVGAATGERLVLARPGRGAVEDLPDDVHLVGADELAAGHRAWLHEEVAGRRWRVSADSFFQARPDGAAALVDAVHHALVRAPDALPSTPRLVDLYAGVGLLAGALADRLVPASVVAVESSASAVADARANLGSSARVLRADVRRWRPSPADAVVADPSRHGLGAEVVDRIAATGAGRVALVSCDLGALGRDAGLLSASGYELASATLVDLFPHTSHVEVVTAWRRR